MIYNGTLILYTRTTVIDAYGGEELSWTIGDTVRCNVQPAAESIMEYAGRIGINATHICFIPSNITVDTTMRVSYNGQTYGITKIREWLIGSGTSNHIELWLSINTSPQTGG